MTPSRAQAELTHLNRIAELLRRGAPLGEIGRDWPGAAEDESHDTPSSVMLASGLLDDGRRELTPNHPLHGLFLHALHWQDNWSEREHLSFWQGALGLWPASPGKRSHTHALGYALVMALENCVDLDDFLRLLSDDLRRKPITGLTAEQFTLRALQRRDAVRVALQMIAGPRHLYPDSIRLPRVVTDREIVPYLAVAHTPLDAHSAAGEASGEIVRAALRAVKRARKLP